MAQNYSAEAAGDMGKQVDELVDAGGELVYNGAKRIGDIELMPADLMEELAQSGVKYTPEDVLVVTKNSDGDLLWLEKGNEDAGLTHILEHKQQLSKGGIEEEEIPSVIKSWLGTEPKLTGRNDKGPWKSDNPNIHSQSEIRRPYIQLPS